MNKLYGVQTIVHFLVGIGALFGGTLGISDPYGIKSGIPVEMLKRGPFTSFLIPGLFLFFIIGIGHLIAALAVKHKTKYHAYISGGAGCILMAWIVIQCYMLQVIASLHVIFFLIGMVEGIIALFMLIRSS